MAFVELSGLRCHYRLEGAADKPVIVLSHSLGQDLGMWDPQMADLLTRFRVLRYDTRGHGATDAPAGDYTMAQLAWDALGLLDALDIPQVAWCGLSMGGMIGQWLAIDTPDRLSHLILANTSPRIADPPGMEARRVKVLADGMGPIIDTVMSRFFTKELLSDTPPAVASARETLSRMNPIGYAGCCAAVRDHDATSRLHEIRAQTLVISGEADESMPWDAHGGVLMREIEDSEVVHLPTAHVSNIGAPRAFTRAVMEFLMQPLDEDQLMSGLAVRRSVLGNAHVDRAMAGATDLTRDFQEFLTRYVWGEIWSRPGLDHRTRRLLVLTTLATLGRWEEFRMHLNAALDHGFEWCDVEELLLQVAVYAGIPTANTGFGIAGEIREKRREGEK
jgi:3-oxoadipate enol-lactonase/4-carboxymuconolactone decarboxylase